VDTPHKIVEKFKIRHVMCYAFEARAVTYSNQFCKKIREALHAHVTEIGVKGTPALLAINQTKS